MASGTTKRFGSNKNPKQPSPWRRTWYPVVTSEALKCDEPYGIQILGDPVVLFRDKNGVANCLADRCPHRSTPLSIGTMRDGHLECKYHGWQFGTGGECTRIPSVPRDKPLGKPFCALSYPVVEKYGLVWVWMGPSEHADARLLPHHLFREASQPGWAYIWGIRDLEIDHGLMIENLLDPAHLPFTHEGTLASRSDATPAEFEILWDNLNQPLPPLGQPFDEELAQRDSKVEEESREWVKHENLECDNRAPGFRSIQGRYVQPQRPDKNHQYFTFEAPATTRLDLYLSQADPSKPRMFRKKLIQLHFHIPVTPQRMRLVYLFARNWGVGLNRVPGFKRAFLWKSDQIIDQDVEMLAGQQVYLLNGAKHWNTVVPADRMGSKYRRWREREEKKQSFWFTGFQSQGTVTDIEDLVPTGSKTKKDDETPTPRSDDASSEGKERSEKEPTPTDVQYLYWWTLETAGSKFNPKARTKLIDPELIRSVMKLFVLFALIVLLYHYIL